MLKICKCCKMELNVNFFGNHNKSHDGKRNECKKCRNKKTFNHWNDEETKLICLKCKEHKLPEMFDINTSEIIREGRDRRCKICKHSSNRLRRTTRLRSDQFHRIFVERFQGIRDRSKNKNLLCEFNVEDLKELYFNQNKKCALSGIEMTTILGLILYISTVDKNGSSIAGYFHSAFFLINLGL